MTTPNTPDTGGSTNPIEPTPAPDVNAAIRLLAAPRKGTNFEGDIVDLVTGALWDDSPLSKF